MNSFTIQSADRVEIITLQDNYIDITARDNSAVVTRAMAFKDGEIKNSILAEHGFSVLVRVFVNDRIRTFLFDFGYSPAGAAYNARAMGLDLFPVEALVLSHGHSDHTGGLEELVAMIGRKDLELVVHPSVFRSRRYLRYDENTSFFFPEFTRERVVRAGVQIVETKAPLELLDGAVLFLGEIERRTDFEKGFPIARYLDEGQETFDKIEDDTAIAINLRGQGLIILSGCAHSGIVNTIEHAIRLTGIDLIHAVMGGFHLSGPLFEPNIEKTAEAIKRLNPRYLIPAHCTGRKASLRLEDTMPDKFILNMSGTKLTFEDSDR